MLEQFGSIKCDPVVAEALEIVARAETLGWEDLWKLFEIIREAVTPDTIITFGWASARLPRAV